MNKTGMMGSSWNQFFCCVAKALNSAFKLASTSCTAMAWMLVSSLPDSNREISNKITNQVLFCRTQCILVMGWKLLHSCSCYLRKWRSKQARCIKWLHQIVAYCRQETPRLRFLIRNLCRLDQAMIEFFEFLSSFVHSWFQAIGVF